MKHPIASCEIRTYSSKAHGWVAQFGDGNEFPFIFCGTTEADVLETCEVFRQRTIAKHEAGYIKRRLDAAKRQAAVKAKKAAE